MISSHELNEEIHHITELSNILRYLFKDRSLCDTQTCCDLCSIYLKLVKNHIDVIDTHFYGELLGSSDAELKTTANNFMSGSMELKRILTEFTRKWCVQGAQLSFRIKNHEAFMQDTDMLFDLVLHRIQDETEHLYPIVRSLKVA